MGLIRKPNKSSVFNTAFLLFMACLGFSCVSDKGIDKPKSGGIDDLVISENFDFKSISETEISVSVSLDGESLPDVPVEIYDAIPPSIYNDDPNEGGSLLFKGATDNEGVYSTTVNLPSYLTQIYIKTDFIGIPEVTVAGINNGVVNVEVSDENDQEETSRTYSNVSRANINARTHRDYTYLGDYDKKGKPKYLESKRDKIKKDFLTEINNSLPEKAPVPEAHPEYLADAAETDVKLGSDADIWVTFVHEGAGYRNALGFYTYNLNSPPQKPEDISELTVIFPNTSYRGSGGGLRSGDKVKIGSFTAGTGIGWFIVANGWNGNAVGDGANIFYSNPDFNIEAKEELKQHNVLLKDDTRNLILLGFEDLRRDHGSDDDFNDAIFYITASEYEAIEKDNFLVVNNKEEDRDGDKVYDIFDKYPEDENKAFNNFYPGEKIFGTLAFEDLWPNKGDYDFNDLVVDYNFNQITNSDNNVVEVKAKFIVQAIGASFKNGLGFQMNISPELVASVSGTSILGDYIRLNANGTEFGQEKATIIVFDNAFDILPHPGSGQKFVNTDPDEKYITPDTVEISIVLTAPQSVKDIGLAPYNPFMIINKERGKEVHLPGSAPTTLANKEYFGQGIDNTDTGKYYKSKGNLPWAMNIPLQFDYPIEKEEVIKAHLTFSEWAQSDGFSRQDWYKDQFGYRDAKKIYRKK